MRTFARTLDRVDATEERVLAALNSVIWYQGIWGEGNGWSVSDVLVLVAADKRYKDSDCGNLAPRLRDAWLAKKLADTGARNPPHDKVRIKEVALGDLFVGIQNFGANLLSNRDCDVMVTLAPSALRYFDEKTADHMMRAFADGAKVAGIAVPEDGIDEFVARGTLGGPISAWDLKALTQVGGGFDQSAAQPQIGEENIFAGCEEIHPLVRILEKCGECYAAIAPQRVATDKRVLEGDDLVRHLKQIESKTVRQMAHAANLGIPNEKFLEFFAERVMEEYRLQPIE